MSNLFDQNNQYRRPQHHIGSEPIDVRPTVDRRQLLTGSATLLGIALLMILALVPRGAQAPDEGSAAQVGLDAAQHLAADCAVIQRMSYAPCGHSMTRRQALPAELAGKGRSDLAAAYDAWQITAFSPTEVTMEQTFQLHCPQHTVLKPDESGMLCVWQNRYGDALALVKELGDPLNELPEGVQDEVRQGKGFDSQSALEQWLESVGS